MSVQTKDKLAQVLVRKTQQLNKEKLGQVLDFVDFLSNRCEKEIVKRGIRVLGSQSKSFKFLAKEPELYSLRDIKQ